MLLKALVSIPHWMLPAAYKTVPNSETSVIFTDCWTVSELINCPHSTDEETGALKSQALAQGLTKLLCQDQRQSGARHHPDRLQFPKP